LDSKAFLFSLVGWGRDEIRPTIVDAVFWRTMINTFNGYEK
jgi:hypothetical protein